MYKIINKNHKLLATSVILTFLMVLNAFILGVSTIAIRAGKVEASAPVAVINSVINPNVGFKTGVNSYEIRNYTEEFKLIMPLKSDKPSITQCYSYEHGGMDISAPGFPEVMASGDGIIHFAGCLSNDCPKMGERGGSGLAWTVIIDHQNGIYTIYGHLNDIYVKRGQNIKAGQSIAQMGHSGTIDGGAHLHLSVVYDTVSWESVNPARMLPSNPCFGILK
jgi:murein DD-endopeptidase MepM/ murein hydrolase activator NlpD